MIKIFDWDETKQIVLPGSYEETLEFCTNHFIQSAKDAISKRGKFCVALSGGSTPKAVYSILATKYKNASIWPHVFLFWSDERCVDPTHSDSNYHMAMNSGLASLSIPPNHVFRMKAEEDVISHAKEYELLLKKHPLDLVLLGMGEDGHTASLFPHTKGLDEKQALVVANYVEEKKSWRMTLTFKAINEAAQAVFYVFGTSKQKKLEEIFQEKPQTSPCLKVGSEKRKALWIIDDAASLLIKQLLKNC